MLPQTVPTCVQDARFGRIEVVSTRKEACQLCCELIDEGFGIIEAALGSISRKTRRATPIENKQKKYKNTIIIYWINGRKKKRLYGDNKNCRPKKKKK
jgi:hypothetical protein